MNCFSVFNREIEHLKKEKHRQMSGYVDEIENTKCHTNQASKSSNTKIRQLQETLEDRKCAMNSLK